MNIAEELEVLRQCRTIAEALEILKVMEAEQEQQQPASNVISLQDARQRLRTYTDDTPGGLAS